MLFLAGLATVPASDGGTGYLADFESPDFSPGSIDGQHGWWVDQGSATVLPGMGLFGSAGFSVAPAALFSQARLSLERTSGSSMVVFFDAWVRLPAAPWMVFDETFDLESARIGLFRSSGLTEAAEWHVFHGDGTGGGYWVGTGVTPDLLPDADFTADWTRLTVRLDSLSQSWDVWTDGIPLATGLGWQFQQEPDFAHFFVMGDPDLPVLLDNVTISSVNPLQAPSDSPAAVAVSPAEADLTDTDADGLPDKWELAHQLDPADAADAVSDRDGDGLTAVDEFLLGTNEHSAEPRKMIAQTGAAVFNRFAGQSARRAVAAGE